MRDNWTEPVKVYMENCVNVTAQDNYKHYSQYKKKVGKRKTAKLNINRKEPYTKFANIVCEELANMMLESDSGAYIKGLGYYYVQAFKKRSKKGGRFYHTHGISYVLKYYPDSKGNKGLFFWSMDRTFRKDLKMKLIGMIHEGRRFKSYPWSLRTFLH
jgi:hypothetical protein